MALWSLLDGIWGSLKGSWGVLVWAIGCPGLGKSGREGLDSQVFTPMNFGGEGELWRRMAPYPSPCKTSGLLIDLRLFTCWASGLHILLYYN